MGREAGLYFHNVAWSGWESCGRRSPGSLGTSPFLKHKHKIHLKTHSFIFFHYCHIKCFSLLFLKYLMMPHDSPTFNRPLQDPQSFHSSEQTRPHPLTLYTDLVPLKHEQAFPAVSPIRYSSSLLLSLLLTLPSFSFPSISSPFTLLSTTITIHRPPSTGVRNCIVMCTHLKA